MILLRNVALIDGDILIYRVGYTTNDHPVGIAMARMVTMVEGILDGVDCDAYQMFLTSSDKSNYRFDLYPEYKANRKAPKPVWYMELRSHLVSDYKASVVFKQEADDKIGIIATSLKGEGIICSIDKDLDQIPGPHYDFVKDVHYDITPEHALRFFYFQLLTGDRVDNIPGCKGIGPKKAERILDGLETEEEYQQACLEAYQDSYGLIHGYTNLVLFGRLLKIKTKEDEPLWVPAHLGGLKNEENEAA